MYSIRLTAATEQTPIGGLIFDAAGNLYGTTQVIGGAQRLRHGFQAHAERRWKLDRECTPFV